jgi:hypothetical protein
LTLTSLAIVAAIGVAELAAQTKPAAKTDGVNVTVKYTGKGTVDAGHRIWVWLFDTPQIGPGAIPIAEQSFEKNGGTATFPNPAAKEVYVAVAFDEAGGFAGQAPPPPGSPIAIYGAKGPNDPPVAVTPGPKGSVTVILTDAARMQ